MKFKRIMLVTLVLLVVLTIGAVSASEDVDTLAADNDMGEDLKVDESSSEVDVVGDPDEPNFDDVDFWSDDWSTYPIDTPDPEGRAPVTIVNVPKGINGSIVVSSGEKVFFDKNLNDFDSADVDDQGTLCGYRLTNTAFGFTSADSGSVIKVSLLNNGNPVCLNYYNLNVENDEFTLKLSYNIWCWNEGDGPLYLDYTRDIVNINVEDCSIFNGAFYISANRQEYKYAIPFGEEGDNAWHSWTLGSFDITDEGLYPITVRYAKDDDSPLETVYKGVLNVTRFNNDVFRVITDTHNNINLFVPDNQAGTVKIFLKFDWDDYYPTQPSLTYQIDPNDYNKWISWNLADLGCEKDEGYNYLINITNLDDELFYYEDNIYYGDEWDPQINTDIYFEFWDNSFSDENEDDDVVAIYIPEKARVYNGTFQIKSGTNIIFAKEINTAMMDFDSNSRDYRFYFRYKDLKNNFTNLKDNTLLTFIFNYNDTQIAHPFVLFHKTKTEITLENTFDIWYWNEGDGPLYSDYNMHVINIDVFNTMVKGIIYVSVNGFRYPYEIHFDEEGNAGHNWLLSSFNITSSGIYPVLFEFATNSTSEPLTIGRTQLNVVDFNYDTFRIVENRPAQFVSIYCPESSEGTIIAVFTKDDWDEDYPNTPYKTFEVSSENVNNWLNLTFNQLGLKRDDENIIMFKFFNGTEEIADSYETSVWFDEPYEVFVPSDLMIKINTDEFREDNNDDTVFELYIPETTMITTGTLNITSGGKVVYSKVLSLKDMEFEDEGRYYKWEVAFGQLQLKNLKSGDLINCTFSSEQKTVSQLLFYVISKNYDDEGQLEDEWVNFKVVNSRTANILRDEVVVQIAQFPEGIDDEFIIYMEKWGGEFSNRTFKISELTRDDSGLYSWNCSSLGIVDTGWAIGFIFYKDGEQVYDYEEYPELFINPDIYNGEVDESDEEPIIYLDIDDLRSVFDNLFKINITHNGITNSIIFSLNQMDPYYHDEEDSYWLLLKDLEISQRGEYNITMEFSKNGEMVCYNGTISVVDFVINTRTDLEDISEPVFRIRLDENATGRVVIAVGDKVVFNNTLSYIGYSYWNRMGGFNIPLNYLQINETGTYDVELDVYDDEGNLLRNLTLPINVKVSENEIHFNDMMYMYREKNFLYGSVLSTPIPIDGILVLYLNGEMADALKITASDSEFGFRNISSSFLNEYGYLRPGFYNARIDLVNGTDVTTFAEGSFSVLTQNGTVNITAPASSTSTTSYISVYIPEKQLQEEDAYILIIYIDPYVNEDGELDGDNKIEFHAWENDFDEFWDGKYHNISLGLLTEGNHKIIPQYLYDDWNSDVEYINHNFFSNVFTINVQKTVSSFTASPVTATYNVAKKLTITLKDANNKVLSSKKVTVKVGSISKTLTTNSKGQVSLDVSSLVPKTYTASIKFAGDTYYKLSSKSVKVKVNKAATKFIAKNVKVKSYIKAKKVTVTLKDSKGRIIKSKVVSLKVKGKTYKVKTNKKGVATFKVTKLFKKGSFLTTIKFAGDKYYKASTKKIRIIVK